VCARGEVCRRVKCEDSEAERLDVQAIFGQGSGAEPLQLLRDAGARRTTAEGIAGGDKDAGRRLTRRQKQNAGGRGWSQSTNARLTRNTHAKRDPSSLLGEILGWVRDGKLGGMWLFEGPQIFACPAFAKLTRVTLFLVRIAGTHLAGSVRRRWGRVWQLELPTMARFPFDGCIAWPS
jgi:hypothetical protein